MQKVKPQTEQEVVQFLNAFEAELEQVSTEIGERSFKRFLTKQKDEILVELQKKRASIATDPLFVETIDTWHGKVTDSLLARRLEVWKKQNDVSQVAAHPEVFELSKLVDEAIVTHTYKYGDKRVALGDIRNIVKASPDRAERKLAWMAYEELSKEIEGNMLALFKARNEVAKSKKYDTYVDLMLNSAGLEKQQVVSILEQLHQETEHQYLSLLQSQADKFGITDIEAWDVQFLLDQYAGDTSAYFPQSKIAPSVHEWASRMDVDLKALGFEMVDVDIPYNGLCMSIGRNQVKVLGNPKDGYSYYKTAFHEMGHALHGLLNAQDIFGLRREPSVFNEGMAETFGYITHHLDWIKEFGLNHEEAGQVFKGSIGPQYHYLRQRTAFCLFEIASYENLDQNLDTLFAETEQRILGGSVNMTSRWAANAWYVNFPVYWQNYVLADVIASQIHEDLREKGGDLYNNKEAFEYVIKHYIKPGASIDWLEKVERTTGKPLQADALIRDLQRVLA